MINKKFLKLQRKIYNKNIFLFFYTNNTYTISFNNFKFFNLLNFVYFKNYNNKKLLSFFLKKVININYLNYLWFLSLTNNNILFKFLQEDKNEIEKNTLSNTQWLNSFNANKYNHGHSFFKLGYDSIFYKNMSTNIINEKKKLFISINSIFFKHPTYWNNFIFTNLNIFKNINYLNTYVNELFLIKLLINPITKNKWKNFYLLNNITINKLYEYKKLSLTRFNFINKNFLTIKLQSTLLYCYLKLQIKGINWLVQNLFINFLKNIYKKNIYLNINKFSNPISSSSWICKKIFNNFNSPFESRETNLELINIIMFLIKYKDPKLLIDWISYNMSFLFYKKHMMFINYVQNILKYLFTQFGQDYNFLGYKLIFKGKINKIGSVRKRKLIFMRNYVSSSNVFYKNDMYSKPILTITGAIGCKIIISYK